MRIGIVPVWRDLFHIKSDVVYKISKHHPPSEEEKLHVIIEGKNALVTPACRD